MSELRKRENYLKDSYKVEGYRDGNFFKKPAEHIEIWAAQVNHECQELFWCCGVVVLGLAVSLLE